MAMMIGCEETLPFPSDCGALDAREAKVEAAIASLMEAVPAGMAQHAPPLIAAAAIDDRETIRRFVESEDGPNDCGAGGKTSLHWAVGVGNEAILGSLLFLGRRCATGLDLEAVDRNGFTALHYAVVTRKLSATRLLVEAGAQVDCRDLDGQTPLMKAARWDDAAQCGALLGAGADAAATDAAGQTALHVAAAAGATGALRLLLSAHGAVAAAGAADGLGRTALNCALRRSQLEAARMMLPAAAYNPRVDDTGSTELHWAAANGAPDIVEHLLRLGPPRWPRDERGMTPLMRALEARNESTAALLLEAPCCLEPAADAAGLTPLHWAARAGMPGAAARLLGAGCPAWAADAAGRDALTWALLADDEQTAAALVRLAGFRQRADHFGRTAAHVAATRAGAPAVLELLRRGARADAVDAEGLTPLTCALRYNAAAVADVVRCYSADAAAAAMAAEDRDTE